MTTGGRSGPLSYYYSRTYLGPNPPIAPPHSARRDAAARRRELARGEYLVELLLQLGASRDHELRLRLIEPDHLGAAIAQHLKRQRCRL